MKVSFASSLPPLLPTAPLWASSEHAVAKRDTVSLEERHAELVASNDEVASHAAEPRASESALMATIDQKVEHAAALAAARAAQTQSGRRASAAEDAAARASAARARALRAS